jgi:hypothetical protein
MFLGDIRPIIFGMKEYEQNDFVVKEKTCPKKEIMTM